MAGLSALLGDVLVTKGGEETKTDDALQGCRAVALYFSAHWCPPCRGFTPKLAEWYTADLQAKGLRVVFVSSDKDEGEFKDYLSEMPWHALPFADRARKEELSKKYKVGGIPTVVIVDADGTTITKDGRAAITSDPKGEEIPWRPRAVSEILAGAKLVGKDGPLDDGAKRAATEGKTLALYFSAHWCPPCRGFTPKLAEWYKADLKAKGLEVIFVSSDRDERSFMEYFEEQPWLALDYGCRKEKEQLSTAFGVSGIPSLVIVSSAGETINKDGRSAISSDPTGKEYPWYPKPVADLAHGPGSLEEAAVVVALCECSDEAAAAAAEAAMTEPAKRFLADAKAKGEEGPEVAFMIAKEGGGIADQLRKLAGQPSKGEDKATARLVLFNIPDDGGYYVGPEGDITAEKVETFVSDFQAGRLERKQLD